jgi:hypothetical protein
MARLKMSWCTEGGQMVCQWVDAEDAQRCDAVPADSGAVAAGMDLTIKPKVQGAELRVDKAA